MFIFRVKANESEEVIQLHIKWSKAYILPHEHTLKAQREGNTCLRMWSTVQCEVSLASKSKHLRSSS